MVYVSWKHNLIHIKRKKEKFKEIKSKDKPPRKKRKEKEEFKEFRNKDKSVLKTKKILLKSILLRPETDQPRVNEIVYNMHELVGDGYQFIRLYVLNEHTINPDNDILLNSTFIKYCLRTVGINTQQKKPDGDPVLRQQLKDFYENEYQPIFGHTRIDINNCSHIVDELATQMETMYKNNCQERFIKHLLRFINITCSGLADKASLFRFKNQLVNCERITDERFQDWMLVHFNKILPVDIQNNCVAYDVKSRPLKYLKCMLYMTAFTERLTQPNGLPYHLYECMPQRTQIIPACMPVTTSAVLDLFHRPTTDHTGAVATKTKLNNAININKKWIWGGWIDLENKFFHDKHYQCDYRMQTDGITCSIQFVLKGMANASDAERKKALPKQEYYYIDELPDAKLNEMRDRLNSGTLKVLGIDPGNCLINYISLHTTV